MMHDDKAEYYLIKMDQKYKGMPRTTNLMAAVKAIQLDQILSKGAFSISYYGFFTFYLKSIHTKENVRNIEISDIQQNLLGAADGNHWLIIGH